MQLSALGEEEAQGRPEAVARDPLHKRGGAGEEARFAASADLGERSRDAILAAVEDAVGPAFAAGILGIGAEDVATGFEDALRHGLVVVGHEEDGAAARVNFGDELGEAARVGEVYAGA